MNRLPPARATIHHHLNHHGSISWIAVAPVISLIAITMNVVFSATLDMTRFFIEVYFITSPYGLDTRGSNLRRPSRPATLPAS